MHPSLRSCPTADPDRLLISAREAAKALCISERKLFALTQPRGTLPCVRLGRSVRYSLDALRRWIAEQTEQASSA